MTTKSANSNSSSSSNWQWKYLLYPIGFGTVLAVGGSKYYHDHVGGLQGVIRSLYFYQFAVPKYVEYRWHMFQESSDEIWDELDTVSSKEALNIILDLHGFYIKAGQIAAANAGNAFPEIWQDTMSVLQDEVPPKPFQVIKEIIKEELPGAFETIFESIEEEPIGAASIGQVHRAILKDGTKVVVKVRYPDIEQILRGDVRTMKIFCQLAQPVFVPALDEMEEHFMGEFDYRQEAMQLETVRNNLVNAGLAEGDEPHEQDAGCSIVPKPFLELCTPSVLVMEEIHGDKLAIGLKKEIPILAKLLGKPSVEAYLDEIKEKEREAHKRGEVLLGPTHDEYEIFIALEDSKRRMQNLTNKMYNVTIGLFPGKQLKPYLDKSVLPINHAKMIDDLLAIHGHEILVNGYFNGDPHPGNLLLHRTKDGSPKIGLIDYGQVSKLTKEQRHALCKVYLALAEDNREEVVRLMIQAGFQSKKMDPEVIYNWAKVGFDEDTPKLTNGLHIQLFMEELQKQDRVIELPRDFIMASRATILLRGLAHAVHQHRSVAKAWKPIAERVLREDI